MRSLFEWKSLILALSVILTLGVVACDDEDDPVTDVVEDTVDDTVADMVDDTEEDTGVDVMEDADVPPPLNACFDGDDPMVDEALASAIGGSMAQCGGTICFDCAIGVATGTGFATCGDVSACTGDPNEGACAMSTCAVDCVRANNWGPCDASDACVDGDDNVIDWLTCNTTDNICESAAVTAVNNSDVDDNCLYCYGLITGCISEAGVLLATTCAADSGSCDCETGQCENGCVAQFSYCSGLPDYIENSCDDIVSCE